ncbi:hypothetical protein [Oceanisphaera pacifica]|uniref:Lipoprotein n=1 Tax=Oceanisphaera pacifica TaxID=2818389 RepID=A0ABS3NG36_9GAMM|nr:hypothetical protein [Oceanisphaera pacifica]MBO1519551.1 hypothetical protein [Oceanisphaera pacifica]
MYKLILVVSFLFSMAGCAFTDTEALLQSMYNVPSSGSSKFDGTKYIRMSNVVCNSVMFELYQDTKKAERGLVLLESGTTEIENIGDGKSLHFKLDGELYSYNTGDVVTEHDTVPMGQRLNIPFSHKTYIIPEKVIRQAAGSEEFLVKLDLANGTFIEGTCSPLTLAQAKDQDTKPGNYSAPNITQEHVDTANRISAQNGFREFVEMMDSTAW